MKRLAWLILITILLGFGFHFFFNRKDTKIQREVISPLGTSFQLNALGTKDEKRTYTIYGYLPYWTIEEIDNFDLEVLTDVAYFGFHLNAKGDFTKTQTNEEGLFQNSGYDAWYHNERLANFLKTAQKHDVNTAITVISHVDDISTEFLNCSKCWDNFYKNLKTEMELHNVKDVNLNFEYYEMVDKDMSLKYTEFTKFVKKWLQRDFPGSQVVVTTFADSLINNRISDIPSLSKVADKLFVMAYDFHISQSDTAKPVSPLGGAGIHAKYDIRTMLKDYLSHIPPQKLILGVPYYGFNWSANDKTQVSANSLTQTYADIMEIIENTNTHVLWDEMGQIPYFEYINPETKNSRTVYFENERSLQVKYKIVKEFDLAGVGIWALGYDENRPELWDLLEREF